MANEIISLTRTSDSATIYISLNSFGYALTKGSGSVVFFNSGSGKSSEIVDETPAEILVKSSDLVSLTRRTEGDTVIICNEKIVELDNNTVSGSLVFYNFEGRVWDVTDTPAAVLNKSQNGAGVQTLTDAENIDWDGSQGKIASVTLTDNRTFNAPTNLSNGTYILYVIQDGTGSRTITWNAAFEWAGGAAPTLSTDADAVDIIAFVVKDNATLQGNINLAFS
jgi:hypothetical protein